MNTVLELDNLTKDYEIGFWRKTKQRALDGVSLQVAEGEIFGFLGPNGAGKTTTIKILMSLSEPTSGTAKILNQDISNVRMHREIGYLPERPYFYDYLTAREFLEYCGELFGLSKRERKRRAEEKLAEVKLDGAAWDKQLRRFSKGMLQRVGLAQALINNPRIVFLDEPMSGLDPVGRREIRDLVASLPARGTTVFFCSHILSDIEALCSRAGVMCGGQLAHLGRLEELHAQTGDGSMEVTLSSVDAARLVAQLRESEIEKVELTPTGARVIVATEAGVDKVLTVARQANGKLVGVQKLGGGLEELFVRTQSRRTKDEVLDD